MNTELNRQNVVETTYLDKPLIMWNVNGTVYAKWNNKTWLAAVEAGVNDEIDVVLFVAVSVADYYFWGDGNTYKDNKWLVSQNQENMNNKHTLDLYIWYKQVYLNGDRHFDNDEIQ